MLSHSSDPLADLLEQSTVLILSDGKSGTGFFPAPGFILTCAHVVGHRHAEHQRVRFSWRGSLYDAFLERLFPDPCPSEDIFPDFALLSTPLTEPRPVLLSPGYRDRDSLYSFGYSSLRPGGESLSAECEGHARYDEASPNRDLIKFKGTQVLPGISGSPLLNRRTGGVCGIVKRTRGEEGDLGGLAIRIELILESLPDLSKAIADLSAYTDWRLACQRVGIQPRQFHVPLQIPLAPAQFSGREVELEKLRHVAESRGQEGPAIVSIQGMAGVGKSSLAVQFAHEQARRFPDGILWANLRLQDIGAVLDNFARAYGEDLGPIKDRLAKAAVVRSLLSTRDALIILDNAESDSDLGLLLPTTGRCLTLVTTRHADLPELRGAMHLSLDIFSEDEALLHMGKVLGDQLPPEDLSAGRKLVAFCGRLPLAVDIVVRLLKRASMNARDFAQLVGDGAEALNLMREGERSVTACFELTWSRLTPDQRMVFARSSIFGGSTFGVKAIESVTGLSQLEVRITMGELFATSLVNITASGRYQFHPLLREFAITQLERMSGGEFETCRIRAADYLISLLGSESDDTNLSSTESAQVELEFDNILSSWRLARSSNDEVRVVRLGVGFTPYLFQRGHWDLCDEVLSGAAEVSTVEQSRYLLLLRRGELLRERADYANALQLVELCAIFYRKPGQQQRLLARTLREMAELKRVQRDYAAALLLHKECLELRLQMSDQAGVAQSLHDCGLVERILGKYESAVNHLESALEIAKRSAPWQLGYTTMELGIVQRMQDRIPEAKQSLLSALASFRANNDKRGQAYALRELGQLSVEERLYDDALSYHTESLELRVQLGDLRGQAMSLYMLGVVEHMIGNEEASMQRYSDSLRLAETLSDRLCLALNQVRMGERAERSGLVGQAREYWLKARHLFLDIGVWHFKEVALVEQHLARTKASDAK